MPTFDFKPFLAALDAAQKAHLDWSRRILRCAVLHKLPDADVRKPNAHHICALGRFLKKHEMVFHTLDSKLLEELVICHIAMHDAIRDIAIPISQGKVGCHVTLERFETSQERVIDLLARFKELALHSYGQLDALTGLPLRQKLQQDYYCLQKQLDPEAYIAVMFLDVDHFKRVNDQFGHLAGDKVLRDLANEAYAVLKDEYSLYRYGGEEFVVLGCANDTSALHMAERLRQHIQDTQIIITEDLSLTISVTIGLATANNQEELSSVLGRADKAMYAGKQKGRNQVVSASDESTMVGTVA